MNKSEHQKRSRPRTPNNRTTAGFRISDALWAVLEPLLPIHVNTHRFGGERLRVPDRRLCGCHLLCLADRLPIALGYTGGARWVAFYVKADKVHYHDGSGFGMGDTGLFLAFKRHPVVAPHLAGAHLGSADTEASEWLVVDRQDQVLYLAAQAAARWHLVAQWPHYHSQPLEYTQEELGRLLDNLKEAAFPPDWPAKLAEALRESRANERMMQQWLVERGTEEQL